MSIDDRQAALQRVTDLITLVGSLPPSEHAKKLAEEATALHRAIAAFHLEGIRFRMYNVDRLITHSPVPLPAEATAAVSDLRHHLEAAGFHTRTHQAPG
jgi:hypothetical protein